MPPKLRSMFRRSKNELHAMLQGIVPRNGPMRFALQSRLLRDARLVSRVSDELRRLQSIWPVHALRNRLRFARKRLHSSMPRETVRESISRTMRKLFVVVRRMRRRFDVSRMRRRHVSSERSMRDGVRRRLLSEFGREIMRT